MSTATLERPRVKPRQLEEFDLDINITTLVVDDSRSFEMGETFQACTKAGHTCQWSCVFTCPATGCSSKAC